MTKDETIKNLKKKQEYLSALLEEATHELARLDLHDFIISSIL